VRPWIARTGPERKTLIVTGHSLGAAMATLTASVLPVDWLVTLGSPRVGDLDFIRTLQAANSVRIVDCCDLVTQVPPPLPIGGYTHVPTCTYLTQDGQAVLDPAQALIDADRSSARRQYLARYSWRLGNVLLRRLADHAPINYARAFFT
jgi:pimeloyl-ACP methyl ester carboxylesterase